MEVPGGRILVTAGSRRLGAAIAVDLASWGAHVAITYRTSRTDAEAVLRRIEAHGVRGAIIEADLARADAARTSPHTAADALGGLDAVVHCASGGFAPKPLAALTEADFEIAIGATLRGALFVSQGAAERLEDGGAIVFVGDLASLRGWPAFLAHSAAKGGLRPLASGLARALAPRIRVGIVHPGTVLPEEGKGPTDERALIEESPLRRLGEPRDVSRAIRYLLEAPFVTGEELIVDGGRSLR